MKSNYKLNIKTLSFQIVVSFLLFSCNKTENKNKFESIGGKLEYINALTGDTLPIKNGIIKMWIGEGFDESNFYLSTRSDSIGNYSFTMLGDEKEVSLRYKDTISNIEYSKEERLNSNAGKNLNCNIIAIAKSETQITRFIVLDDSTKATISNADIYFFNNFIFASNKFFGLELEKATTNSKGEFTKIGYGQDSVFIIAMKKYPNNDSLCSDIFSGILPKKDTTIKLILK